MQIACQGNVEIEDEVDDALSNEDIVQSDDNFNSDREFQNDKGVICLVFNHTCTFNPICKLGMVFVNKT